MSGHAATVASRVRGPRPANHIRVFALNNQWKQSSFVPSLDQDQDNRIEEGDESCEISAPSPTKSIQPKFKSKLPFSPKSYRKNYS